MESYPVEWREDSFHIQGFPDAVKAVVISKLVPDLSSKLANISAFRLDLRSAKECLDILKESPPDSKVTRDALWRNAIVCYGKCFGKNNATGTLATSKWLPAGIPREVHRYFITLRNKHIVHDENSYRQFLTGAIIAAEGKDYKVEKVVCNVIVGATFTEENLANLTSLVDSALEYVTSEFDKLCDQITTALEEVDYARLISQPDVQYTAPGLDELDKVRQHL
jgi:hypothetical protein